MRVSYLYFSKQLYGSEHITVPLQTPSTPVRNSLVCTLLHSPNSAWEMRMDIERHRSIYLCLIAGEKKKNQAKKYKELFRTNLICYFHITQRFMLLRSVGDHWAGQRCFQQKQHIDVSISVHSICMPLATIWIYTKKKNCFSRKNMDEALLSRNPEMPVYHVRQGFFTDESFTTRWLQCGALLTSTGSLSTVLGVTAGSFASVSSVYLEKYLFMKQ